VDLGAGIKFNKPLLLSQSQDWLISFWQNFFVTKIEFGNVSFITKTLDLKIAYTKSYTFELAQSVLIGLTFKIPK
jgi:hypothetical protein